MNKKRDKYKIAAKCSKNDSRQKKRKPTHGRKRSSKESLLFD